MECFVTLEESSIVVGYVKVYPSITMYITKYFLAAALFSGIMTLDLPHG